MTHKWAHNGVVTISKKKAKVFCSCGKQSPFFADTEDSSKEEQASDWYTTHTGLVEKRGKETP